MHLIVGIVVLVFLAMLGVMLYEMPKAQLGKVLFRWCLALSGVWVALAVGVVLVVAGYAARSRSRLGRWRSSAWCRRPW
jgi:hypothetical protein